jgi:hypothetical protein
MTRGTYLRDTQHPWSSVIFVLPLLFIYEAGLILMPSQQPESLRNGADTWFRGTLASMGMPQTYWAPGLLVSVFLLWSWLHRKERPDDFVSLWIGMVLESAVFALGLWGMSRGLWPLLQRLGLQEVLVSLGPVCQTAGPGNSAPDPAVEQMIGFLGAGVYEETLFRLLLYSGLMWLFHWVDFPAVIAFGMAAVASALLFAGAHHIGPQGEAFDSYVFLFRTLAGVYFAFLFQIRGFGIAVGAHTGYDLIVGIV